MTFVGTVWVVLCEDLMEEENEVAQTHVAKVFGSEHQAQDFTDSQNDAQDRFLYSCHEREVEDSRKFEQE